MMETRRATTFRFYLDCFLSRFGVMLFSDFDGMFAAALSNVIHKGNHNVPEFSSPEGEPLMTKAFVPYATAIGFLLREWNDMQEALCKLFCYTIWHSGWRISLIGVECYTK